MKYAAPMNIELTARESKLYKKVFRPLSSDNWPEIETAMPLLTASLLRRNAVPEVRVRLFTDLTLAEVRNRSPHEVFEMHGVHGDEIMRHVDFVPWLRHFIHGPELPRDVIEGLVKLLNEHMGTSGMLLKEHQTYARNAVRTYRLSPATAATEFFRLGVEIGMSVHDARTLRDAARSTT